MTDPRVLIDLEGLLLSFRSGRTISSEAPGNPPTRPVETLLRFPPTRPATDVVFHNGAIASGVPVQLLFWGSWWKTDPEGASRRLGLIAAMQRLLDSPYLSELDQYGVAPATYRGALIVEEPGPPTALSSEKWHDMIWELIDDGRFPETDESGGRIAYMVILPQGTTHPNFCGAHGPAKHESLFDEDAPAWTAWIGYDSVDKMSSCLSHELAELMTSPELDGWHVDGVDLNASEIGDICDITNGWVNGVFVRAYWSNRDGRCVIPTDGRMVRIDGTIAGRQPHEVESGTYSPSAPDGVNDLLPACHLEGSEYEWTLSQVKETADLDATTQFFTDPAFEWSVAGVNVPSGAGRVSITVEVTREAASGPSTSSEQVSLAYQASGSHLELKNDSVVANMDIPVTVTVFDQAGAARPESPPRASVVVSFQGALLSMAEYAKDIEACQRAADELWKKTHKGYNHGPVGPLGEANRELLASQPGWITTSRYRQLKAALTRAEAIESIDPAAGRTLRQVLVQGLRFAPARGGADGPNGPS